MKLCPKSLEECQDIQHPTHCIGADRSPDPSPKGPHQDLLPLDRLAVNNLLLERAPKGVSVLDCATLADAIVSRFGSRAGTRSETAPPDEFAKYRDSMNGGAVEFCGDCGAPCVVVRPGKTQCESCDWWRFGNSESERNARIVAALRGMLARYEYPILREVLLAAGEPAPSEEQREAAQCQHRSGEGYCCLLDTGHVGDHRFWGVVRGEASAGSGTKAREGESAKVQATAGRPSGSDVVPDRVTSPPAASSSGEAPKALLKLPGYQRSASVLEPDTPKEQT